MSDVPFESFARTHFGFERNFDVDVIRRLLAARLGGDPGTLNFCYPYARFMSPGGVVDVMRSWSALASRSDLTDVALYVHIPFCPGHCMFCGFATTYGLGKEKVSAYLTAFEHEIQRYRNTIALDRFRVRALFIGGGTPNYLDLTQFERLIGLIRRSFHFTADAEITVELYPRLDMVNALLPMLTDLGVNRVSVCAQDFNDDVLVQSKRFYRGDEALQCAAAAAAHGIEAMNVDLMIGIPGQVYANASANLDALRQIGASHVTLNPFSRRSPSIPWARKTFDGVMTPVDGIQKLYNFYADWLLANGYRRATKTNFERDDDGRGFVYERLVRQCLPRMGFGVNALSFTGNLTYRNVPTLEGYVRAAADGALPVEATYALNEDERMRCRLFFASLEPRVRSDLSSHSAAPCVRDIVDTLADFGLARYTADGFELTDHGVWNAGIVQRCFLPPELLTSIVST